MMPAAAVARATDTMLRAPPARAPKISTMLCLRAGPMGSLRLMACTGRWKSMIIAMTQMALKAASSGECRSTISSQSSMPMGTRKCAPATSVLKNEGSSLRGMPRNPNLEASMWVM